MTGTTLRQARDMLEAFETRIRHSGKEFLTLKEGSPEWMSDVCYAGHDGMFPDDCRYEYIYDALVAITNSGDGDIQLEPDLYNSELLDWAASRPHRADYVDRAMSEVGATNLWDALAQGQLMEREEVLCLVLVALAEVEDDNDD